MIESAKSQPVFLSSQASPGEMFDFRDDDHPAVVSGWNDSQIALPPGSSHFGFVGSGDAELAWEHGQFSLGPGMYFSVPGEARLGGSGAGFIVSLIDDCGLFQVGGPIEPSGRLQYIDGCSDTLLVAPPMLGDACLNLLHIPPFTNQTAHTHPSLRVGMVVDGDGVCRTPDDSVPLSPGLVFAIRTDGVHSFHTEDRPLRIVAWHPDSDFGPTHESHPMLNRTLVDGQPVNAKGDRP